MHNNKCQKNKDKDKYRIDKINKDLCKISNLKNRSTY